MVSFAGFAGMLQAVGNVSSVFQQGALYGKTPVEITYSVRRPQQGALLHEKNPGSLTSTMDRSPPQQRVSAPVRFSGRPRRKSWAARAASSGA